MAKHAPHQLKPPKRVAVKKSSKKTVTRERGARIVVLTGDPHRNVVIVPGCHLDSIPQQENTYFFEDGNELVGMIVEGGTVECHSADRTYVVRLTDGQHTVQ
jgi:hypothetical protein